MQTQLLNESPISFTEIVKHIKQYDKSNKIVQIQNAIEADQTGIIYLYAKGNIKFIIKRYRTGRFIKKVWN